MHSGSLIVQVLDNSPYLVYTSSGCCWPCGVLQYFGGSSILCVELLGTCSVGLCLLLQPYLHAAAAAPVLNDSKYVPQDVAVCSRLTAPVCCSCRVARHACSRTQTQPEWRTLCIRRLTSWGCST